ncbi:MAG: endonuclease/exonuclease/phosphatase family protein [Bacteroidales bacterium]|jgi:endonuclease/exonuclease/phosphatase family metal-dependent hydrolase|nr:endonuclease/exonuclease/phosphatase family protein [Bacteroidales bacterium]
MKKTTTFWRVLIFLLFFSIQTAEAQSYDFKVTTWNVEWLSCLSNGPSNRELQINNVVSLIKTMDSDFIALQEVGTSNTYTTIDTLVRRLGSDWAGKIVPWKVGNCNQSQGIIYKKSKVILMSSSLITNGGTSYDWSSGRFPVLYDVDFIVGDKQIPIAFFNIHAKAYSDVSSYTRRKNASIALKNLLDSYFNTTRVVILGDFNDYLYGTMCTTCGGVSPYKNFMDDDTHYKGVTAGLTNYYYGNSVIDNIIISNELLDEYLSGSAFNEVSATKTIPNYYATTSDHIPVSIIIRIPNNVNIADMQKRSSFFVYPNPTTGKIVVSSEYQVVSIEVFDMIGKRQEIHRYARNDGENSPPFMEGWQPQADEVVINISHLPAGIYFIKVNEETTKIIKY